MQRITYPFEKGMPCIPYRVIGIGIIFAFFNLLSILGVGPSRPTQKFSRAPQNTCFAMISSLFGYGIRLKKAYGISPANAENTPVPVVWQRDDSNPPCIQGRPATPRSTIISYGQKEDGSAKSYTQASSITASPSQEVDESVKIYIPEGEPVEILLEDIQKEFPNVFVCVREKKGLLNKTKIY